MKFINGKGKVIDTENVIECAVESTKMKSELQIEKLKLEIEKMKRKESVSSQIIKGLIFGSGAVILGNHLGGQQEKW